MHLIYNKVNEAFFVNSDHSSWVNEHHLYNCEELIEQYEAAENRKEIISKEKKGAENAMQSRTPVAIRFMNKRDYAAIPPGSKRGLQPAVLLLPYAKTYNGVLVPVPQGGPFYAVKWFV